MSAGGYVWPQVSLTGSLTKYQPDPKPNYKGYNWSKVSLTEVVIHLVTRCLCWGYIWPEVSLTTVGTHYATRCLYWGYVWPKISLTGILTKCQPDPMPNHGGYIWPKVILTQSLALWEGSIWPKVSLTQRSVKNVYLTWSLNHRGSIWLSAKRTSENLKTLCVLGLASQRSFPRKAKNLDLYILSLAHVCLTEYVYSKNEFTRSTNLFWKKLVKNPKIIRMPIFKIIFFSQKH